VSASALLPGLCSVTFRGLSAEEVLDVAIDSGLVAIEWGGDVHVRSVTDAARVGARCVDAGVQYVSYGSYLGAREPAGDPVPVLDIAQALGSGNVRMWCPLGVGPTAGAVERSVIISGVARAAAAAHERGQTISLEYHPGTLTETASSARQVLEAVDAPNLFVYWQPVPGSLSLDDFVLVRGDVSHLHVFWWERDGTRLPLSCGFSVWPTVFSTVGSARWVEPRVAFLEFVAGDDPAQLRQDAATLRGWL
jgi:sugar phosphate isomerase/epimerase